MSNLLHGAQQTAEAFVFENLPIWAGLTGDDLIDACMPSTSTGALSSVRIVDAESGSFTFRNREATSSIYHSRSSLPVRS